MANVIVLEPSSLPLTDAETFGDIEYISKNRFNLFNIDTIISKTRKRLEELDYDPLEDYICLTGQGQKLAIFVGIVASMYEEFTLLMFDARENRYKERVFRDGRD